MANSSITGSLRSFTPFHVQPSTGRECSRAEIGYRNLVTRNKGHAFVSPKMVEVHSDSLLCLQRIDEAIHWTRSVLVRGISNQAGLAKGPGEVHRRGLQLLTSEIEELMQQVKDPVDLSLAICQRIASYGLGNCHECSELTYLYLCAAASAGLLPAGAKVLLFNHPEFDHATAGVIVAGRLHLADAWLTLAVPAIAGGTSRKLDFDAVDALEHFKAGRPYKKGRLLRCFAADGVKPDPRLAHAVSRVEEAARSKLISDAEIMKSRPAQAEIRYEDDWWMLSKHSPVVAYSDGAQQLRFDRCSVNDHFQAEFSRMDRLEGKIPRAGNFDFSNALDRLVDGDASALLQLQTRLNIPAEECAPLILELLQLGCNTEERTCAMLNLVRGCAGVVSGRIKGNTYQAGEMLSCLHATLMRPHGWLDLLTPAFIQAIDAELSEMTNVTDLPDLLSDMQGGKLDYAAAMVELLARRDGRQSFSAAWTQDWGDDCKQSLWLDCVGEAVSMNDVDAMNALLFHPNADLAEIQHALVTACRESNTALLRALLRCPGLDLNRTSPQGDSALNTAIRARQRHAVRLLLRDDRLSEQMRRSGFKAALQQGDTRVIDLFKDSARR